jgi:hypothetical protein
VSTEAIVLALSTVIRPTSAAAVVAMLATRHPQRLLVAYIVAGLAFSLSVGTLVVVLLQGMGTGAARSAGKPVIDVVLGGLALGTAAAVWFGWLPRRRTGASERADRLRTRLQDLSPRGAATAGVITHLPGLIYLAALNAIVASATGTVDGMAQVAVYNAIWFSMAIVALVLCMYRQSMSRAMLDRLGSWTGRRRRAIIVWVSGAVGSYLVVSGVLQLAE